MKSLDIDKAKKLFFDSDAKYVSQEQASICYDDFSGNYGILTYEAGGCLIVKGDSVWHIHALCEQSDVLFAINEVKKMIDLQTEKLMVLTLSNVPKELNECRGAYKFIRGYKMNTDTSVRILTVNDSSGIMKCCSPDSEDTLVGQDLANEFLEYHKDMLNDPNTTNLGLFINSNLVGFVQAFKQTEQNLSTINIFVNILHRKKGYTKRLLSAICAISKDEVYCYSCVKTNLASINTAKSCGFEYKGAYLFIDVIWTNATLLRKLLTKVSIT